jgi:hypothetical protein
MTQISLTDGVGTWWIWTLISLLVISIYNAIVKVLKKRGHLNNKWFEAATYLGVLIVASCLTFFYPNYSVDWNWIWLVIIASAAVYYAAVYVLTLIWMIPVDSFAESVKIYKSKGFGAAFAFLGIALLKGIWGLITLVFKLLWKMLRSKSMKQAFGPAKVRQFGGTDLVGNNVPYNPNDKWSLITIEGNYAYYKNQDGKEKSLNVGGGRAYAVGNDVRVDYGNGNWAVFDHNGKKISSSR